MPNTDKHHVVVLGGGFGGVAAAKELGARLSRRKDVEITLVDRSPTHVFTPLLYEVATAYVEHGRLGTSELFASGTTVDLASALSRWGVDFVQAEVEGIVWDDRSLVLREKGPMRFDHLVIALGSETNFFGIDGLERHAHTMKTLRCADALRIKVHELLHGTEKGERDRFDVLIGGAGPTGIEFATELTSFIRRHLRKGHLEPSAFRIAVVEAQSALLPALGEPFSGWTAERLERLGITAYLDTCIQKVDEGSVVLVPRPLRPGETAESLVCDFRSEKQRTVKADLVVWTGGVKGPSVLSALGLPTEGRAGSISVGTDLRVSGRERVYAVGDVADIADPATGRSVPWLAQTAIDQGRTAARRIAADIAGGEAPRYRPHGYPMIVTLGGKHGIAKVGGRALRGGMVWFLREAADLRYFLRVLPFRQALMLWWRGVRMFTGND